MDEVQHIAYFAVIPANVRYDDRLSSSAKLLYGEITALASREGYCYAKNSYFSALYQSTNRSIQRQIRELEACGHITVCQVEKQGEKKTAERRIYIDASAAALFASDPMTKMSRGGDKNVTGGMTKMSPATLIKNNTKEGDARAKSAKDQAARNELLAWASTVTDEPSELAARLMDFCDARSAKRKPLSAGRAVTALTNKLTRYSEGSVPVMLRMLDESIERGWDSVYQLKPDVLREVTESAAPAGEDGGDKWL